MKTGLALLIAIHGIIHLFGFLQAFRIIEFNAISHPISRTFGLIWLTTFVFFAITIVLMLYSVEYWWVIGIVAVTLSQLLIFNHWSDAKLGTIANIIILGATISAYSTFQFSNKVREEREQIFQKSENIDRKVVTEEVIKKLPRTVQKWLTYSGVVGKEFILDVHLIQDVQIKMNEGQKEWSIAEADQYFTIQPPAFNWKTNMQMNSIVNIVGRDKFENGCGEMSIRMFSLIPIAEAKNSDKVNEATLQRYLAEIVWFPTAALSPYLTWEPIDDQSAKATMTYQGTIGSGIFHFDNKGEFIKFTALRFKDIKDKERKLWTVSAIKTEERNGIKIPVKCEAKWKLGSKDWTWLKLNVTDIRYNMKELPKTNSVFK